MRLIYLSIALLVLLFTSCSSGQQNEIANVAIPDSVLTEVEMEISNELLEDVVDNISSPVEMAAFIKSRGADFSAKFLAPTDGIGSLPTSYRQAFSLGVYGADLGYLNMYDKNTIVLDYLSAINELTNELRVGQFFDFETLKRLSTNSNKLDSLMYISVHSFNEMDAYLRKNNRGNLSTLIISGIWVEGLYLATQVAKENPNEEIKEKIGEQKLTLDKLLMLLNMYKKDPEVASFIKDLEEINDLFKKVNITYEVGERKLVEENGELIIIQNDKSIVHITNDQLEDIIFKTKEIRNNLLNN